MLHVPASHGTSIRCDLEDTQNFLVDCTEVTHVALCLTQPICLAFFSCRPHLPMFLVNFAWELFLFNHLPMDPHLMVRFWEPNLSQ